MLRRTTRGWQVVSHEGKPLSKPNLSHQQAQDRLAEVEMFKAMGRKKKRRS